MTIGFAILIKRKPESFFEVVLSLPRKILFVDVETTGLSDDDRVVSFGGVQLDTSEVEGRKLRADIVHLIFDPGIPSHPMALKVHGYDDWTLRHQDPFPLYAHFIRTFVFQSDLVVAHNADFDLRFIARDLAASGESWPDVPSYCTMQAERRLGLPASLDASCRRIGIVNRGKRHSALDDALRAMAIFLARNGMPSVDIPSEPSKPTNLKPAPRKPKGGVPDRDLEIERARIERLAKAINSFRREILPSLSVIRWIVREAFAQDKRIKSAVIAFAKAEAAALGLDFEARFPEIYFLDAANICNEWPDVRAALDSLRFDLPKRRRLGAAIEDTIRADGVVAPDEVDRLRQVAEYLGGQIAFPYFLIKRNSILPLR